MPNISFNYATKFSVFNSITTNEVIALIRDCNSKFSILDPIPAWLIKECASEIGPFLTVLFNKSLMCGDFPCLYKIASVTSTLKKVQLDPAEPNNYRPVSNLHFFSKLLEKVVLIQMLDSLNSNNLFPEYQSAYR